jgi:hypothetical protein
MVNLTESFTKLYGRRPTEEEVASMWQMKREQEGFRKQQLKEKTKEPKPKRLREPKPPTKVSVSREKFPYRASRDAKCINRLLILGLQIKEISYALGHNENFVMAQIEKWQLPRPNDDK